MPPRKRKLSGSSHNSGASCSKSEKLGDDLVSKLSPDDAQAQKFKQSISTHLLNQARSFRFSQFHPPSKPADPGKSPLEDSYIEHLFQEFPKNVTSVDSMWDEPLLSLNEIVNSVDIPNRGEKLLLIGRRGCGMTTALLKSAVNHLEASFYDFVLILNETMIEIDLNNESCLIVSFGKQRISLSDFCAIYGRFSLLFVDNSECLPISVLKLLTSSESFKESTILFSFQTYFQNGVPENTPKKLFRRCYLSYGFSSSQFKTLGKKMLGGFWSERLFDEIQIKLEHDDDVTSLCIVSSLLHRKTGFQVDFTIDDCKEKFISYLIIEKLKLESPRVKTAITAEEIAGQFESLKQLVVSFYSEQKTYFDKELLDKLSLSLKLFVLAKHTSQIPDSKTNDLLQSIEENVPNLAYELRNLRDTHAKSSHSVLIDTNRSLRNLDSQTRKSHSSIDRLEIKLKELILTKAELTAGKELETSFKKLTIKLERCDCEKLLIVLSKFPAVENLRLSFKMATHVSELLTRNSLLSFSSQLQILTFEDIPQSLLFDAFTSVPIESPPNLRKIAFRKLNFEFSNISRLSAFSSSLLRRGEARDDFKVDFQDCTFNVTGIDRNVALAVVLLLSSCTPNDEILRKVDSSEVSVVSGYRHDSLDAFKLSFSGGILHEMAANFKLISNTCEKLVDFFSTWQLNCSKTFNFYNFLVECSSSCDKCSSLLSVLSIGAARFSYKVDTCVDFGNQSFQPSNFDYLASAFYKQNLKLHSTPQQFSITIKCKFAPLSASVIDTLKSFDVFVEFDEVVSDEETEDVFCMDTNESSSVSYEVIEIEVDNSGWGFTRFVLTREPITISFSNGVTVEWLQNSTVENRLVCVEVHAMPENLIKEVCLARNETECLLSPFLFIDQLVDKPFLVPVTVTMPYTLLGNQKTELKGDWSTKVFAYCDGDVKKWRAVSDQSKYELKDNVFKYTSTTFSPVGAVTHENESNDLNPTVFWEIYLPESVYLIVCPSQYDTKIIFDCRKFRNEEEHKKLKLTAGARFRKLNEMKNGDLIYGSIAGNLGIDENYGYNLRDDKKLLFHYPDPEHESNKQEYKMKILSKARDPEGTITYYKEFEVTEKIKKQHLFHLKLELQVVPSGVNRPGYKRKNSLAECPSPKKHASGSVSGEGQLILNHETLTQVLKACKDKWPRLLESQKVEKRKITELENQNLGEVLLSAKDVLSEEQRKKLIREIFTQSAASAAEFEGKIEDIYHQYSSDTAEAFWKCGYHWLKSTSAQFRNISTVVEAVRRAKLDGFVDSFSVIFEGTCLQASRELIRAIDKRSDEQAVVKEIAVFLQKLGDNESQNLAFSLLLKL